MPIKIIHGHTHHQTTDGRTILLEDLAQNHLLNIINKLIHTKDSLPYLEELVRRKKLLDTPTEYSLTMRFHTDTALTEGQKNTIIVNSLMHLSTELKACGNTFTHYSGKMIMK